MAETELVAGARAHARLRPEQAEMVSDKLAVSGLVHDARFDGRNEPGLDQLLDTRMDRCRPDGWRIQLLDGEGADAIGFLKVGDTQQDEEGLV